jgi:TRAP-type C4-dicarboxylate transport system permease small subunit
MLLLARWRRSSAIVAIILTTIWVILLLPDIWHYYAEWSEWYAPTNAIVEPLQRELWIRGYILIFMPIPFLFFGLRLLRRRSI